MTVRTSSAAFAAVLGLSVSALDTAAVAAVTASGGLSDSAATHWVSQGPGPRLAQANKTGAPVSDSGDVLAPLTDWLERSAKDFQSIIVKKLSTPPPPEAPPATPPAVEPTAKAPASSAAQAPHRPGRSHRLLRRRACAVRGRSAGIVLANTYGSGTG